MLHIKDAVVNMTIVESSATLTVPIVESWAILIISKANKNGMKKTGEEVGAT